MRTKEENIYGDDLVPDIVSFNLGWDACQKQQKNGYKEGRLSAISDVEKIVDKIKGGKVICVGIGEFDKLISAFELKQGITRLKGEGK